MKNRHITKIISALLVLLNVGLFTLIWFNYYNDFAFRSHRTEGFIGAVAVYYIVYRWLSKLYRGYAIASSSIGETVLSQFISFGIADLVLYVACNLLYRQYVNVLPGVFTVLIQLLGTLGLVWLGKQALLALIKPTPTLLVRGDSIERAQVQSFIHRLCHKHGHLFAIRNIVGERDAKAVLQGILDCENVIFYGIDPTLRGHYIEYCLEHQKTFFFVPEFVDIICRSCSIKNFLDTPLMRYDYSYEKRRNYPLKRLCDVVFSLLLLIVLSPMMAIVALLIRLEDGGPVFFRQERVTLDGKTFNIFKFRSMVVDAERYGAIPATENDPRITRIGRHIRRTRIDETPQLINILLGQMSFVGPRPERSLHVALYEQQVPEFKYRLRVKGGLTGYAQIYGKYNTTPEDKLKLDMLYIENQSMLLDFKLVLLTLKTMFTPESTEGFDEERSRRIHQQDRASGTRRKRA